MISSVNAFLGFDKGSIPEREFLAIGKNVETGSFLLHQVVSAALKEQRSVCLVSFAQKFHHYNSVSHKIGSSLQSAVESKQLQFVDGLEDLTRAFFPDGSNSETPKPATFLCDFKDKVLKSLQQTNTSSSGPVLVVDELCVLLSAGCHLNDVYAFISTLQQDLFDFNKPKTHSETYKNGSSLIISCSYSQQDKDSVSLWNYLTSFCSVEVNVTGLQTGYCKDVHGQAAITWREGIDEPRQRSSKSLQFKLVENSVNFFAAGTSAAVL